MSQFARLLRRFAKDESGVFAVIFGLMAIVLIALGGAVVDYVSLEQTRARAQVALDAAALALQPEIFEDVSEETILAQAEAIVLERIGDINLIEAKVDRIDMDIEAGRLFLGGQITLPTIFVRLVGVTELSSAFSAEAVRGAVDIEVSVALDVTGSMQGQRIVDLRDALGDLIDAIVQDDQEPNYSKMALIPYSQAVNAGAYAEALRGPITQPRNISNISWVTGGTRSISGINNANQATVSSDDHGFNNGDWVYIWGVSGMSQINNRGYQVTNRQNDSFQLSGVNSNGYSWYWWGGQVRKCQYAECEMEVTSNGHGFSSGQYLHVTNVGGLTGVNNRTYRVSSTTPNKLKLAGSPSSGSGTYQANTGKLHCTWQNATEGCTYYYFPNADGGTATLPITTCVTERAGNPYNDQPPSATYVGRNYAPSSNGCLENSIVPLTSDKDDLHELAENLVAAGSTSGSLGVLWSWYMLSPNFGYVWPEESRPAPYRQANLLKAAIIMTDGEFNTVHYDGVVARNSGSGSGNGYDHHDSNAHNGDPYPQARAYCDAMKASTTGIVVYTVGFGITAGSQAANVLTYCASAPENAYLASNGAALAAAFEQIARNISSLRLSL